MAIAYDSHNSADTTHSADRFLKIPNVDYVTFALGKINQYTHSDKPIFVNAEDPLQRLTAGEIKNLVQRQCKGWEEAGLQPGDCVTIHSPNNIIYPCLWLGVIAAGGIASGSNPAYKLSELEHHITVTGTKFIIAHEKSSYEILIAASRCNIPPRDIFLFNDDLSSHIHRCGGEDSNRSSPVPSRAFSDYSHEDVNHGTPQSDAIELFTKGRKDWQRFDDQHQSRTTAAVYALTSGTTGLPKAAVIPHAYLVSQSTILEDQHKSRGIQTSQLVSLPIFHTFAGNIALVTPLRCGITTYLLPRFDLHKFIAAIERYAITDTPVVPPIVGQLVRFGREDGQALRQKLQSLRRVICAGAVMNPEVQRELYQHLSADCTISQCWGTTETGWLTLTHFNELDFSGSVGQLAANTKLKVVPVGKAVLQDGVSGEACVSNPGLFLGYRNNHNATVESFNADGYYKTGDRVRVEDGRVFIEGRIKETMKINAWQVSPEELDAVLCRHPAVKDCAVVGRISSDAQGLQNTVPTAFVVLKEGAQVSADDIVTWFSTQVIHYKRLTGGVRFEDTIPRVSSGKVLRRELLAHMKSKSA